MQDTMLKAENYIQQEVVVSFTNRYCLKKHNPRCVIYSIPNESENSWETQKKLNIGLLPGASDLVLLLPGPLSLYMECKTPTGVQSDKQKEFQANIEALGFKYHLFRSEAQFWQIVNPYLTQAGLEAYNG
jgi:hypothetical protein